MRSFYFTPFHLVLFTRVFMPPFSQNDFLEVELFEQRPGIPAGQGRRSEAAVPPGELAPQPWGPAADSDHQGSSWAPSLHCKGSCFGSAAGQKYD